MTDPAGAAVDEREVLLRLIADQRRSVRNAVGGLTEEQARATPSASKLSLAAVVKHLTQGERSAIAVRVGRWAEEPDPQGEWLEGFQVGPDESVPTLLARWAEVAALTEQVIRAEPDLGRVVELSEEVRRWLPARTVVTVRWMLLHLLEETARHAGHADVIRESIDGKGAWELEADDQGIDTPDWE